jgi:hypothetical protein
MFDLEDNIAKISQTKTIKKREGPPNVYNKKPVLFHYKLI